MEYRKLISFGKSSYVVSLPKTWIDRQKLKKGDFIYFNEKENNLVLQPKESDKREEEKEIVINIDNKEVSQIRREVNSAYTLNYHTIIIKGETLKGKVREIQEIIHANCALEIMEQTPTSVIAKDFLRMDTVSLNELIRKMDLITRTMIGESIKTFKENLYEDINQRDEDINRLYLLLRRTSFYRLTYPLKTFKETIINPIHIIGYLFIAFYIESIADEARRIARYMQLVKLNKQQQKSFENLFIKVKEYYLETMKAVYTNNPLFALNLSNEKKKLINETELFYSTTFHLNDVSNMVNRLRKMISDTHQLGRVVYQELSHNHLPL